MVWGSRINRRDLIRKLEELSLSYLEKASKLDKQARVARENALEWYKKYRETGDEQFRERAIIYYKLYKELESKATASHKIYVFIQRVKATVEISRSMKALDEVVEIIREIGEIDVDAKYKVIDRILNRYEERIRSISVEESEEIEKELEKEVEREIETKPIADKIRELEKELEKTVTKRVVKEKE